MTDARAVDAAMALGGGEKSMSDRKFLFNYRFDGAEWGITIFAANPSEAKEKIKAVALARYEGELEMRIPAAVSFFGLVPRAIVWLRQRRALGGK
jgi:hypothetical protein